MERKYYFKVFAAGFGISCCHFVVLMHHSPSRLPTTNRNKYFTCSLCIGCQTLASYLPATKRELGGVSVIVLAKQIIDKSVFLSGAGLRWQKAK